MKKFGYVLKQPFPKAPTADSNEVDISSYNKYSDEDNNVTCVMFAAMSLELQKQHDGIDANTMNFYPKELYNE